MNKAYIRRLFVPLFMLTAATQASFPQTSRHADTPCPQAAPAASDTLPDTSLWHARQPLRETRAVWLTTIGGIDWPRTKATDPASRLKQQQELTAILDQYQRANINTVILQTRVRASLIYPSAIEPWETSLTGYAGKDPGYDPLAFCIDECHKRGMELHAWIVCIPIGTQQRQAAYGKASIAQRHKHMVKKTASGEMFMMPGHPETAKHIAAICREIAERYDIDGISLDYIRYPEATYRFSDDNLYSTSTHMSKADWRRDNITRIVRSVHDAVKPIKPWVKLSSSPIGKYADTRLYSAGGWNGRDAVYQDPKLWISQGYQDMLFPMMYFLGNHFYPFLYDWQQTAQGHPIIPGLGIYFLDPREGRWSLNDVRAEMHAARSCGIGGMAFYRSDFLTRNVKGLLDCACDEFFPYPALTARMTWQSDTIAPPAPLSLSYRDGVASWTACPAGTSASEPATYIMYNVYGSNTYPVDTSDPANLLRANLRTTSYALDARAMRLSYYAVTAIDRFGNESQATQLPSPRATFPDSLNVPRLINRDVKHSRKR